MTDSSYTHITILADRTGSMGEAADGTHGGVTKAELTTKGIHQFIREQAAQPGKVTFTLVQFDTYSTDRVAVMAQADAPAITEWTIQPRGGTPLLDALGTEITMTGEDLAALPEDQRPGRVFFVTGTDGQENQSHEYTKPQVAEKVTRQREEWQWDFVFIGADIDAFAEAASMGITRAASLQSKGAAMAAAYAGTSSAVTRSRVSRQPLSYTEAERKKAAGS